MINALIFAVAFSWLMILALTLTVLALARQVGVLHMRVAPAGALMPARGLTAGDKSPVLHLKTLDDVPITIGAELPQGAMQLLLFVSPRCPLCKQLIPIAKSFARHEGLRMVLVGDDAAAELRQLVVRAGLQALPFVNDAQAGRDFQVDKLPHAVLISDEGTILSRGLVNSREHLESLVIAHELGMPSVQTYLSGLKSRIA